MTLSLFNTTLGWQRLPHALLQLETGITYAVLSMDALSFPATIAIIVGLVSSRRRRAASPWPLLGLMLAQSLLAGFDFTCR
jgi:hypothetical protein